MRERSVTWNGTLAGVLGATSVAAWFLLTDTLRGRPFGVPLGLGHNLLHFLGVQRPDGTIVPVATYTIFHYTAFIVVGIGAAAVAHRSRRDASLLAGAFLLFAVLEGAFFGFAAFISATSVIGAGAWYQIGIANLIAATVMGMYLWRAYPHLVRQLDVALSGRD